MSCLVLLLVNGDEPTYEGTNSKKCAHEDLLFSLGLAPIVVLIPSLTLPPNYPPFRLISDQSVESRIHHLDSKLYHEISVCEDGNHGNIPKWYGSRFMFHPSNFSQAKIYIDRDRGWLRKLKAIVDNNAGKLLSTS